MLDFLDRVWGSFAFHRRLLVWDSLRAHITEQVKSELRAKNTLLSVIPAGCTRLCQRADVSWNAPFKAALRNQYNKWLSEGHFERTAANNMRPVNRLTLIQFVTPAWATVSV